MKSSAKRHIWLLLLLSVATGLALSSGAALAQAGKAPGAAMPAQYEEEPAEEAPPGGRGVLDIRIQSDWGRPHPPGDLILSSPTGEIAGFDPRDNYYYRQMYGASYLRDIGPSGMETAVLYVRNALSGTYSLRVVGTDSGKYRLFMKGYDQEGNHADLQFTMLIEPGQVHHYLINYSNQGGAYLKARRTRIGE